MTPSARIEFFPLSSTLEPLARYPLWHPYATNEPLVNGLDLADVTALVVVSGLAASAAYWAFERRDLA